MPIEHRIPILIVDDRPENLVAMEAMLADPAVEKVTAGSGDEALRRTLKHDFALVLLDVQMPDMDGFETAELLRANPRTRHLPIIFVTAGMDKEPQRFKGYDAGAVDYLVKPIEPAVLQGKVRVFCDLARQRRELERREQSLDELVRRRTADLSATVRELNRSRDRYRRLLDSVTSYVYHVEVQDGLPRSSDHGPGCEALTGFLPEAFRAEPHLWLDRVPPAERGPVRAQLERMLAGAGPATFEHPLRHQDGSLRWVRSTLVPHHGPEGQVVAYDGVVQDITERKQAEQTQRELEACLAQARHLESLGNLAGGVAHDLNNVLAAILGMADICRERVPDGDPMARSLDTIGKACLRGRDVVRSLSTFARLDPGSMEPVDLNLLVWEAVHQLRAQPLDGIELRTDLQDPLPPIQGDPSALAQALMAVCANAKDAMPAGGRLTLGTRRAGDGRLEVWVGDTGTGMEEEVRRRAMEPFFTTRPVGKGSGMGLAIAHGTLQAHGGTLELRSEPGRGTEAVLGFAVAEPEPAASRIAGVGR